MAMRPEDFDFAVELANTMGWNMTLEDFAFNCALEPEGCFVLFEDACRIGLATCISYGRTGWFGNLIVNPQNRRIGAGAFLVRHAINYLHKKGVENIGLYAYPHLAGFYGKIGFVADEPFSVLRTPMLQEIKSSEMPEISARNIDAVVRFDESYFGGNRRRLLRSIVGEKGNLGFAAQEASVIGYVAAKVYDGLAEVGPLVCISNRMDVALSLLKAALSRLAGFDVYLCAPKNQTELLSYLFSVGFREQFCLKRMFLSRSLSKNCIYIAESMERG